MWYTNFCKSRFVSLGFQAESVMFCLLLSVCLPVCLSVCLSSFLSVCPSVLSVCLPVFLYVCLPVCMYVCLSVHPQTAPCPHDNSSQISAEITKFAQNVHTGILGCNHNWKWRSLALTFNIILSFDSEFQEIWFVCAITHHRFRPESPNLHQKCILGYYQLVLEMGGHWSWNQGHFDQFDLEFYAIGLVRVITWNGFELKSSNLHQIWILGFSKLVSKMGVEVLWPSLRLKKRHSTLLLYTYLGLPRCVARHKRVLVYIPPKLEIPTCFIQFAQYLNANIWFAIFGWTRRAGLFPRICVEF